MPGRFKDYIAMPKVNNYQSLHTTVIGPTARPLEIQIRTYEMHEQAEYGIAAHWLYKKSGGSSASKTNDAQRLDDQINWLKHSLDWAASDEITDAKEYLHSLKVDLFDQEIFVFTPKGEVMALRAGSTPLDFAYAVHTEVGNHCVGAKINGAVAPLTHEIKTGDRVEILTNKSSKPSRDWLKIVKTPSAKSKIRRYFAAATKDDDAATGRDMLAKDLRKRGYGISTPRSTRALNAVAEQFNFKQLEDLFAAVGAGKVAPRAVGNKVEQILDPKPEEQLTKAEAIAEVVKQPARGSNRKPQKRGKSASNGIIVKGESNSGLLVRLAHCCNPVTGDDIVGFITRGRGVSVHRANCPNVKGLMEHPERMIDVEWDGAADTLFQVEIVVECLDRMGLLKDVTIAIGDAGRQYPFCRHVDQPRRYCNPALYGRDLGREWPGSAAGFHQQRRLGLRRSPPDARRGRSATQAPRVGARASQHHRYWVTVRGIVWCLERILEGGYAHGRYDFGPDTPRRGFD